MSARTTIFVTFCFVISGLLFSHLILYRHKYFSSPFERVNSSIEDISFVDNSVVSMALFEKIDEESDLRFPATCTTQWYKQLHLEFGAFGVNHFEKVMFLMDDYYKNITKSLTYKCIFYRFGTNFIYWRNSTNDI